jgi:carbonic anhydrase
MNLNVDDYLPRDRAGFYRYNGSLTTPNCNEGIIWTVFTNTLPISKNQVLYFINLFYNIYALVAPRYSSGGFSKGARAKCCLMKLV